MLTLTVMIACLDGLLGSIDHKGGNRIGEGPGLQRLTLYQEISLDHQCQDEYQFWHDLAHRLGIGQYFPWQDEEELNRWLLAPTGISLEDLSRHPEGFPYKPIQYCKWQHKQKKILTELDAWGLEARKAAGTGVIADLSGYSPGKTIAIRADIDALPLQDEVEQPYC
ncbi:MAG: formate dehydrogenase, partial [Clostridia bacterium]|nr:formate dehydrogenase [Clostridia bacterium]